MSRFWTLLSNLHSLAGPVVMLLYPLYASVIAIETPGKEDDEQWLAYWILYSLLTLTEMLLQSVLEWIPIWYTVKLVFVVWMVLPQFRGAAFIYERFVREQIKKHGFLRHDVKTLHKSISPKGKGKKKFVHFIVPKKVAQEPM
ncbi:HVA22-like protein d [Hibiscus syriacus]|uniref:HVA22-like protein n=1 Tax=Hibiscus syriacus TaxID=106335 RepID=A0A6A2YFP6_HIBSY|nr:HVA22-like protein e [Hibiscus syriacus]KAE8675549.1 HVA22-like protein d [Hibiscus syriacus]